MSGSTSPTTVLAGAAIGASLSMVVVFAMSQSVGAAKVKKKKKTF
jgi:hypothetical protein